MDGTQRDLWRRLEAFQLDDASASLTFTRRLARENDWEPAYARRVVDEYKRFVFLAMTAGHEVTPSDEVDQAWHLHLTYTRSYWGGLCGEVLGRPLHHGPTKGGADEGARFEEQYEQTFASYRAAFEAEPPADIWPPSAVRFGEAPSFVRVNRRRVWLLPKPWRLADRRPFVLAGAWIAVTPPLAAVATWNPLDFDGPQFLTFYGVGCLLALVGAVVCRKVLRTDPNPASTLTLSDPAEIAALQGGWQGTLHSAIARLLRSDDLRVDRRSAALFNKEYLFKANRPAGPDDDLLTRVLLAAASGEGQNLSRLATAAKPLAAECEERLAERGLLETDASFWPAKLAVLLLLAPVWLLGVAKLGVGVWRDKPVGFLIVFLVVTLVVGVALLRRPRRTRAGDACLERTRAANAKLREKATSRYAELTPVDAALAVGLFGVTQCGGTELVGLRNAARGTPANSGGTGCGSGCGGGDGGGCGGGGCGGCGGCS